MKKMLQKSLSVFLSALMLLFVVPAFALAAEDIALPKIAIEKVSETPTELVIAIKVTENHFNCLDLQISSADNLNLKTIEIVAPGSHSSNIANGKISIAYEDGYIAPVTIANYTFEKLSTLGVTANDISVELNTCYIDSEETEGEGTDVSDSVAVTVDIPATHTHVDSTEWEITKTPSCSQTGIEVLYCTECGEISQQRDIDKTTHKNITTETKKADCENDGYEKDFCNDCQQYVAERILAATGHIDLHKDIKAPTCTEDGYSKDVCSCGEVVKTTVLPKTDHPFIDDVKAATCTEDGYIRKFCTVCKKIESEQVLGKTDHSWGEWEVVDAPTYSKPGVERRICANCGIDEERAVDKLVAEVTQLVLSQTEIGMNFRQTDRLFVSVLPEDAAYSAEIVWSSSNEYVATVNEDGEVYAANLGTATITASTADGSVVATCEITVKYSFLQWIIIYILFGWIWYL